VRESVCLNERQRKRRGKNKRGGKRNETEERDVERERGSKTD
jgi:hypothetical protein